MLLPDNNTISAHCAQGTKQTRLNYHRDSDLFLLCTTLKRKTELFSLPVTETTSQNEVNLQTIANTVIYGRRFSTSTAPSMAHFFTMQFSLIFEISSSIFTLDNWRMGWKISLCGLHFHLRTNRNFNNDAAVVGEGSSLSDQPAADQSAFRKPEGDDRKYFFLQIHKSR